LKLPHTERKSIGFRETAFQKEKKEENERQKELEKQNKYGKYRIN